VREITVERGVDPREFPLVIAGGAGALHACMIADELEIPALVVPATASVLCAAGMLLSDLQHDFVRTLISPLAHLDQARLQTLVAEMIADGDAQLGREGVAEEDITHQVALDLRYLKQYHEVTLPVPRDVVANADVGRIADAFHGEHNRLYGYDLEAEGTDLELINVRVRSVGAVKKPSFTELERGGRDPAGARKGRRRAYLPEEQRFEEIEVYDGHRLQAGNEIAGPALVERTDTTIFISGSYDACIDGHGSCRLTARDRA